MAEPGWYDDAHDPQLARWFDGQRWTEDRVRKADHPNGPPPPPPSAVAWERVAAPAPTEPAAPAGKPWWRRWWAIAIAVFLVLAAVGSAMERDEAPQDTAMVDMKPGGQQEADDNATTSKPDPTTTTTADPFAGETRSQNQARRKAADYLDYSAFSRTGLIRQLEFEGFSTADATYGTDALNVDWNEQAAKKAAEYLDYSTFSRRGLIEQLMFEGFTQEEAEYGVGTTGL